MNVDQIVRLASFQADSIRQAGTLAPFVTSAELLSYANVANLKVELALRSVNQDYFVKVMNSSTDTTAQKLLGVSYTPSTSLRLATSTTRFSLPPDFQSLKSIRVVTSGYEYTTFIPRDLAHRDFRENLKRASTDTVGPGSTLYYDITGARTLWIAPQLSTLLDIEIAYVARTGALISYSTGTVAVTDATTAVTGSSTVWVGSGTQFDTAFLDIMFGTSASATVPTPNPNLSYDDVLLSRVSSITTDTALVLQGNKSGTLAGGTGYLLSSIPQLPTEYHQALVEYVAWQIAAKRPSPAMAAEFKGSFGTWVKNILSTNSARQINDIETVEDYLGDGD